MTTADLTYSDGSVYTYSCTLPVGTYSYYFQFLAGSTVLKTTPVSGPTVSIPASLSGTTLVPAAGSTSTPFGWSVTYTHGANTAPGYSYLVITKPDGTKWWHMMTTADTDYSDGSLYSYGRTLPVGVYSYYFQFQAGTTVLRTATTSGPTVNSP